MKIEEIDKNLAVETSVSEPGMRFLDVRGEPFELYGFCEPKTEFRRMPRETADRVNPGVARLAGDTAGGRVRFSTDSDCVAIKAVMRGVSRLSHMPLTGTSGFDLYLDSDRRSVYYGTFTPPWDMTSGFESIIHLPSRKMRGITINFPLYNNVAELFVGLKEGSDVEAGEKYHPGAPTVYYGSSITQGGCASRPGNAYQAIISRRFNRDFLNLGFSGSARGERVMAEYIAGLEMSAFVCDYDHNAPDTEHLRRTHLPLAETFRAKQPETPIIFVTKPDYDSNPEDGSARRSVIWETYTAMKARGDRRVYFVDGSLLFGGESRDVCTVDSCHPNDAGFVRMANIIGEAVERAILSGEAR